MTLWTLGQAILGFLIYTLLPWGRKGLSESVSLLELLPPSIAHRGAETVDIYVPSFAGQKAKIKLS